MKKAIVKVYVYYAKCFECNKEVPTYITLSDFGDAPVIKKCKVCDTLYWYTPEDVAYIQPLEKQLDGASCVTCNAKLSDALIPTHKDIKCCNTSFSLDDNFASSVNLDSGIMKDVEVYLLYHGLSNDKRMDMCL